MKKYFVSLALLGVIFFGGCSTTFQSPFRKSADANVIYKQAESDLEDTASRLVTAIKDIVELTGQEKRTPTEEIVHKFSEETQRILGLPIVKLDVERILESFINERKEFNKIYDNITTDNTLLIIKERDAEIQSDYWKKRAEDAENKRGWFQGLWQKVKTGGIIAGLGLLAFLFISSGGLTLLFTFAVKMLTQFAPRTSNLFGVTSTNTLDETIISNSKFQKRLKRLNSDEKLSPEQVLEMHNATNKEVDHSTHKTIKLRAGILKANNKI